MSSPVVPRIEVLARIMPIPGGVPESAYVSVEWSLAAITPLITAWPETPDWLRASLSGSFNEAMPAVAGTKPPRGIITDFPLFSALCSQPAVEYETAARVAQAVLVTCIALLQNRPQADGYLSAIRNAGLAARRIGEGRFVPNELIEALRNPLSLRSISRKIRSKSDVLTHLPEEEQRLVGGLRALLVDALDARAPRTRSQTIGTRGTTRQRQMANEESLTPPHELREDTYQASEIDLAEAAAGIPESPRRRVILVDVRSTVPDTSLSPRQRQWRGQLRARAIASSAQGLMLGSDRLHLVDLEAFETAVMRHLSGERRFSETVARGALICSVSLLCGRPIQKLKDFSIVMRRENIPSRVHKPYFVASECALVLPVPALKSAFNPSSDEAQWYRPVVQQLTVPLPQELVFTTLLQRAAAKALGSNPFAAESWSEDAAQCIDQVNGEFGSRINLSRIAEFLGRQILVETGDWAEAALFCGSGDANARLHYYSPTHGYLRALWRRVWLGVAQGLQRRDISIEQNPSGDDSAGFCSRGCPTQSGVKTMVANLLDHCRSKLRGRRSQTRILDVHNAIALYTVVMVLWHCGARAVNDPVQLSLFDPETGFLGLSDKDTDAYYASRVVWLPPIVQRQISAYWAHLHTLRYQVKELKLTDTQDLFFIDTNRNARPISQRALKSALAGFYPYRLNAQRHYHRTMLRELGVPAQVIDAHLGHGAVGQEAYGPHSCFSPRRQQLELGPALNQLSKAAGWAVLKGLS